MTVLLTSGTTGKVEDTTADVIDVGSWVRISFHDENGNFSEVGGIVREVLEN